MGGCESEHYLGQAQEHIEHLNARIAELEAQLRVPGVMRCAKCKFQLLRSNLNAATGAVTVRDDSKTEPCPNGCGPLWPETWPEYTKDMADVYKQRIADLETKVRTAGAEALKDVFRRLASEFDRKSELPESGPLDVAALMTADRVMAELFPEYREEARRLRGEGE